MSRTIQSNLCDGVKQEAIKLLLVGDVCTEAAAARGRTLLDNSALLGTAAPAPPRPRGHGGGASRPSRPSRGPGGREVDSPELQGSALRWDSGSAG